MTTYNKALDIIDAFTMEFLRFYNQGVSPTREIVNPALVIYSIYHRSYGPLGTIRLRKIAEQSTDISITYPPKPDFGENFSPSQEYAKWLMKQYPEIYSSLLIHEGSIQDKNVKLLARYPEWLYLQRQASQQFLIKAYLERINQELSGNVDNRITQPPEQRPNVPTEKSEAMSKKLEEPPEQPKPWEQIPNHLWDRVAVQMWHDGYTNTEIGTKLYVSPRRVSNILSELRKTFGTDIVPTNEMRRQKAISNKTRDKT